MITLDSRRFTSGYFLVASADAQNFVQYYKLFFTRSLADYKYNLPILAMFEGEKVAGIVAEITEPFLQGGIAEYTPQFGEGHWSLRFPDLDAQEAKNLLSKYAKSVLK